MLLGKHGECPTGYFANQVCKAREEITVLIEVWPKSQPGKQGSALVDVVHSYRECWNETYLLNDRKEGHHTRRILFPLPFSGASNVFHSNGLSDNEILVFLEMPAFEPIVDCPLRRHLLTRQTNAFDWLWPRPMTVNPKDDWFVFTLRAPTPQCMASCLS